MSELELSSPPHLHINSDKPEIITNSPYAHQTYKTISNKIQNEDKTAFHDAIIEMLRFCKVNSNILNPYMNKDFNFHAGYNLFTATRACILFTSF